MLERHNISLRVKEHRDYWIIKFETFAVNQGSFKGLLQFRVDESDKKSEKHLKCSSSLATNINKTAQNTLILCCGKGNPQLINVKSYYIKRIFHKAAINN